MKKEKFNKFKLLTTFFVLVFSVVFISGLVFAACEDVCLDFDGDGYGSPASAVCDFPALDCDDFNPLVTFGVPELCFNAFDDDCDGLADCNDADCVGSPFCVIVGACDDNIFSCGANCFPGNLEICDGYDNNCNGTNDDGVGMNEENCSFLCPVFYDYNAARVGNFSCCGDDGGEGNPYEAAESFFCGDGNDNDCDGDIDMADSGCSGLCSTDNEREWPNILEPGDCNQCNDLLSEDNDGDQGADWPMADMCDADCQLDGALVTITVPFLNYEVNETSCNDIYDNDCDGNINCNDSDCAINPICACSDGTARNSCSVISGAPWYCNGAGNLVEGCGCQNANACCGIGCNNTNDNDCAAGCVPDGCNGNCPAGCNVAQDADCGCQNANACCGIGCNNTNDNDCAAGCVPDGCNGNCPAGCNVAQDADCGCQNANACCGIGCNNTNDNDCGLGACVFPFTFPCAL